MNPKIFVKLWRNKAIIFESVFACESENQQRQSVSTAAIIEILGETALSVELP